MVPLVASLLEVLVSVLTACLALQHVHECLRRVWVVDVDTLNLNYLHQQIFELRDVHLLQIGLVREEHCARRLVHCVHSLVVLTMLVLILAVVVLVLVLVVLVLALLLVLLVCALIWCGLSTTFLVLRGIASLVLGLVLDPSCILGSLPVSLGIATVV